MTSRETPAIIAIGGFDPSGGAGVLVDFAAARSVGVHSAAVITLDTVQDGRIFSGAKVRSSVEVEGVLRLMKERFSAKVVKMGALGNAQVAETVVALVREWGDVEVVLDPVISSTTGGGLIDGAGERVIRESVLKVAALITPNTMEAARLVGGEVRDLEEMRRAAFRLVEMGAGAALVKGGHIPGERVADVLCLGESGGQECFVYERPRLEIGEVRGTGCALASLIAAELAKGAKLEAACKEGVERVAEALERSAVSGRGPGFLVF